MSLEIENIEKSFYCASKEVFHICNNFFSLKKRPWRERLLVVNLVLTLLFRKQFQKSDYFYVKLDQLDKMTMNFQLKCLIMGIAAQVRLNTIVHICWAKRTLYSILLSGCPISWIYIFCCPSANGITHLYFQPVWISGKHYYPKKFVPHLWNLDGTKVIVQPSLEASFFKEPYAFSMSDLCWIGHS